MRRLRGYLFSITMLPVIAAISIFACSRSSSQCDYNCSCCVEQEQSESSSSSQKVYVTTTLTLTGLYGEYGSYRVVRSQIGKVDELGEEVLYANSSSTYTVKNGSTDLYIWCEPFVVSASEQLLVRIFVEAGEEEQMWCYEHIYPSGERYDFSYGANSKISIALQFDEPTSVE